LELGKGVKLWVPITFRLRNQFNPELINPCEKENVPGIRSPINGPTFKKGSGKIRNTLNWNFG